MATAINKTYFTAANGINIDYDSDAGVQLQLYIDKYEPVILKQLFGHELYLLIQDELNNSTGTQRIVDIVEGKAYTVDFNGRDQAIRWEGLENSAYPLIGYYVYYCYQRDRATITGRPGEFKPMLENSSQASMADKIQAAWFELKKLYGYYGQSILKGSAYNFMAENEDDYPEWIFEPLGSVNSFDL